MAKSNRRKCLDDRKEKTVELSKIFLFVIAIILLPLAAFASGGGPGPGAVLITQGDNGKQITVSQGRTFEVRLEQSGGTGYLWQIVNLDETHLKVLESSAVPLKTGRIVGAPLLKTWKIKAVKAGQTDLRIVLYRPWEGAQKAVGSFQVNIQIR